MLFNETDDTVVEDSLESMDVVQLSEAIDMSLEHYDAAIRASMVRGGHMSKLAMERAYSSVMTLLRCEHLVMPTVMVTESAEGAYLTMEESEGILSKIWNAIKKAFNWLLEKIGLSGEDGEKADASTSAKVEKAKQRIKDKYDKDGRLVFVRTLKGFSWLGSGTVRPEALLGYVNKDLVSNQKAAIDLAGGIRDVLKASRGFVDTGKFSEDAPKNIDKTFETSKAMSDLISKSVPTVKKLADLAKHDKVKQMADTYKTKLINANVVGFGPYYNNGYVTWMRHAENENRWSIAVFSDLSEAKDKVPQIEFGNAQDYAKSTVEILDAIDDTKMASKVADSVKELTGAAKDWFKAVEGSVEKVKTPEQRGAVLKHAREVLSYANACVHGIESVRKLSKHTSDAIIGILIKDEDRSEADAKEAGKRSDDEAKAAKAEAKKKKAEAKSSDDGTNTV